MLTLIECSFCGKLRRHDLQKPLVSAQIVSPFNDMLYVIEKFSVSNWKLWNANVGQQFVHLLVSQKRVLTN
jgi:hypothetical protein